nr:putative ribonuclease H-like domain-containing protein [Tanacetum cinerariifolium]
MYENFSSLSTESLESIFNRLQKINTHVVVWRNKLDLDTMSIDDLYNNFKIVEQEVKGTASSSSSSSSQNMAFVSSPSSTNEVNTAYGVNTSSNEMVAINGAGFEWSYMTDEEVPTNMAPMAFSDSEQIVVLKRDISYKDLKISVLKRSQIPNNSRKGVGFVSYNAIPPPYTGLFSPPKLDLSNSGLEEIQQLEFEGYGPKTNDKLEKKTIFPTAAKKEFVRPKQQENQLGNQLRKIKLMLLRHQHVGFGDLPNLMGHPQKEDQGYVDSGYSRYVTGNMSYLSYFKEFNEGYVTFEGGANGGRITSKGTIKSGNLDFKDVYFIKELKFNLFSVSHMCDRKNNVLFTDTKCLVLSPNFKLPDESQILLRVPRKNNMYSVDMKNIVHEENLTCLVAKATLDKSMVWHRRLEIENLVDKKVKVIRCDNEIEFKNSVMNDFCAMKGIRREFSIARTPWQNGVVERRNKTLIEVARTMLADSKLPIIFWAEAVNTACYVQNRVLVVKPHNKTPYELFRGITPALCFMRPFGFHVTILNTLDYLEKFDGNCDAKFLVRYLMNRKAFILYNIRAMKVEENFHIRFLQDNPIIAGTEESLDTGYANKEAGSSKYYILMPLLKDGSLFDSYSKQASNDKPQPSSDAGNKDGEGVSKESGVDDQERPENSIKDVNTVGPSINTASTNVNTGSLNINTVSLTVSTATLKATHVDFFGDETEVDMSNITNTCQVPTTPNTRIHKDHLLDHVIGDVPSDVQTMRMTKTTHEQGFISAIYEGKSYRDLNTYLFAYFLSQIEPTMVSKALYDPTWVEAMQEELLQFKLQKGRHLFRNKNDDTYKHIEWVLDIVSLFNIPGVTRDSVMLCVFPITLTRAAKRWVDRLTSRTIDTWDLLKKAFIQRLWLTTLKKWHDGSPIQSVCSNNNSEGMAAIISEFDRQSSYEYIIVEYEHVVVNLDTYTSSCYHHREYQQDFTSGLAVLIIGASKQKTRILVRFMDDFNGSRLNSALLVLVIGVPRITANAYGTSTSAISCLITAEDKEHKMNDVKSRSILLMALPNEHLLTFSQYKDAKTLFKAIQPRFDDLEQIHEDDLEEIDLKWQLALLSIRARRPRNQVSSRKTVILEDTSSKAMVAIGGAGFDWSYMGDHEVPTNMALMAFSDSEVKSINTVNTAKGTSVTSVLGNKGVMLLSPQHAGFGDLKLRFKIMSLKTMDHTFVIDLTMLFQKADSSLGCSRHMTGNKSFLLNYQEYDGGFVAFVCSSKGGKFDGKANEGFLVGYSINSKAFRVYNSRTKKVEQNLHVNFLANKPNVAGSYPEWLFDIDSLTNSMNYQPVSAKNRTNGIAVSKIHSDVGQEGKEKVSDHEYILLPVLNTSSYVPLRNEIDDLGCLDEQIKSTDDFENTNSTNSFNTASPTVNTTSDKDGTFQRTYGEWNFSKPIPVNAAGSSFSHPDALDDFSKMANLEDTGIFDDAYDDRDEGVEADYNNLEIVISVSPIPSTRVYKDHPKEQIIREIEPKKVIQALDDESWVEGIQKELLQFKLLNVWTLVDLPHGKRAIRTKLVYRNKRDQRGIVTKIHVDNESAIYVVKNPVYHLQTKHIEIRHHYIRDSYEKSLIEMVKIHTNSNVADLLTKAFDVT